jgi:type II secretory pathway component PulJ
MRLAPARRLRSDVKVRARHGRICAGFTLAEVLAALTFMAIVIPVAIEGLRIANLTGQVSLRKTTAARVAERVLNEWLAQGQSQTANLRGTVQEGVNDYRWSIRTEPWNQDTMRLATAEVLYTVQGREYDVRVSTLIDSSTQ